MINSIQRACYLALFLLTVLSGFVLIPVNVNMIVTATIIVYIGSTLSLKLKHHRELTGEANEDVMTANDAYMFPLVGSAMLFSLYCLFRFFDKEWVNLLLTSYFALFGALSLTSAVDPLVSSLFFSKNQKTWKKTLKLPMMDAQHLSVSVSQIVTGVGATIFAVSWFQTRHFMLNNIFGIAFSIKGIESLGLGSYKTGAILLSGLFFYDIFWVFGTDVMVTVATSFDGPIKLLFPRQFATDDEKAKFSMLGLGDIVIPGIFVALLLRYDAHRANILSAEDAKKAFSKPFFHTNLVFYALGLVATVLVMYAFNAAQPALLYLVPACLGSSLATAGYLGEFSNLLAYSEEEDEKEDEGSKEKEETKKSK